MNLTITPTRLKGSVTPPPSKSQAHRLIIAAALAAGESVLTNVAYSQDIEATLSCMEALGAQSSRGEGTLTIVGIGDRRTTTSSCMADAIHFDCGESGSTLRFLIPIALAAAGGGFFTGRGRLLARPQQPYADLFAEKGIFFHHSPNAISLRGTLEPGTYALPGNVSSQFVTGLLYALPLLAGDSVVELTTPLESRGYVDMTLQALEQFGVTIETEGIQRYRVPGGQRYRAGQAEVEADWSQAGFYYAALALGNELELEDLNAFSAQGDMAVVPAWMKLRGLGTVELDVSNIPDLVPALALQAALRTGQITRLVNAARLRIKESDRLDTVTTELNKLGARVEQGEDFLTIQGVDHLTGGTVDSHNDHRIAMMLAMAATRADGPVTLLDAGAVAKSYPNFWEEYIRLGGVIAEGT